jgi:hypothetical protein
VPAVDLSKVDRSIAREPAYHSQPLYGLLVIGPEARERVWLVQDGDTLYVDSNGNGDLTEPGKAVKPLDASGQAGSYERVKLQLGGVEYGLDFFRFKNPAVPGSRDDVRVAVTFPNGRTYAAWGDETGPLALAPRRETASILHFGGPLQMGFEVQQPLTKASKDSFQLLVGVGTKGWGPGSFVHLRYSNNAIPDAVQPHAVLEFPAAGAEAKPVRVDFRLKERC